MTEYEKAALERLHRRIDPESEIFDERIHPDDLDVLQTFAEKLQSDNNKGPVTQQIRLNKGLVFSAHHSDHGTCLSDVLAGVEGAVEAFTDWVENREISDESGGTKNMAYGERKKYGKMIRALGSMLTPGDQLPAHLADVSFYRREEEEYDPTPHPSTILHWDDHVVPILDEPTVHIRDKALCAVAWDSGARPSELHRLTLGDIEDAGNHMLLALWNGKTGNRTRRLICSMPYLKKWLSKHPVNDHLKEGETPLDDAPDDTALWTHEEKLVKYSSAFTDVTKDAGDAAGVSRPTNPKQFRKSRASILAMDPLVSEDTMRTSFGWKPTSNSPAHYKAKFGTESDEQIAAADGAHHLDLTPDHEDPAPVECPKCERWTPRHRETCLWCERRIDPEAAVENQAAKLRSDEHLKRLKLMEAVAEGDVSIEELRRMKPFAAAVSQDDDIIDEAERFLEARDDGIDGTAD